MNRLWRRVLRRNPGPRPALVPGERVLTDLVGRSAGEAYDVRERVAATIRNLRAELGIER